jgi:hypothetical protein
MRSARNVAEGPAERVLGMHVPIDGCDAATTLFRDLHHRSADVVRPVHIRAVNRDIERITLAGRDESGR